MMDRLFVRNWEKWQSYRTDRGRPPWIKAHRSLLRDWEWIELSDAERGQLLCIWLLAADKDGELPCSPRQIQKLCYLDAEPDINRLIDIGFLEWRHDDAKATSLRRQHDHTEAEAEAGQKQVRSRAEADSGDDAAPPPSTSTRNALTVTLANLRFRHDDVHKPKFAATLREWIALGVTPDDLTEITAVLRDRDKSLDFGPAYLDKPLREYLEAKRNGHATSRRPRSNSAAQRNADLDAHLDRKIRSVT